MLGTARVLVGAHGGAQVLRSTKELEKYSVGQGQEVQSYLLRTEYTAVHKLAKRWALD